jgi:AmmeMemoRadiSam system protein A
VQAHAAGAALYDPRFSPLTPAELPGVHIEISVLTAPELLTFRSPQELLTLLRPNLDGVILSYGGRRATFLPQVWEKVPDPVRFLEMLSEKMGASSQQWRMPDTDVMRYQVEVFEEPAAKDV